MTESRPLGPHDHTVRVLDMISKIQASYGADQETSRDIFVQSLDALLDATGSDYGFAGEIIGDGGDGAPWLRIWAMADAGSGQIQGTRNGVKGRSAPIDVIETQGVWACILDVREPVIIRASQADLSQLGLSHAPRQTDAVLGLPMMMGDDRVGVVIIANRLGGYDDMQAQALMPITAVAAGLVHTQRAEAARVRAEAAAKHSESRYSLALRGIGAGLWERNELTGTVYWSEHMLALMGVDDPDFVPSYDRFREQLHPGERERCDRAFDAHMQEGAPFKERFRIKRRCDDRWIMVDCQCQAEWGDDGAPIRVVGSCIDVTEVADAQARADDAGLTAEVAIKSAGMGRWRYNFADRSLTIDRRFASLLGRPELAEAPNALNDILEQVHTDERDQVMQGLRDAIKEHKGRASFANRVTRPDGVTVWLQAEGAVTRRDDQGDPLEYSGIISDMTPLKQAEEDANEIRRLYDLAIAGSEQAVFDLDITKNRIFASPQYYHMMGVDIPEGERNLEHFLARVHADDVDRVLDNIQRHDDGVSKRVLSFRMGDVNGGYIWVEAHGVMQFDEAGMPLRVSGTLRNITEKRLIEGKARKEGLRAQMALSVARLGVWELDVAGQTVTMDHALADILGAQHMADQVCTPDDLFAVTHSEDLQKLNALISAFEEGQIDQVVHEHRIINGRGETAWIKLHMAAIDWAPDGSPSRLIGIVGDLSEQKRAEQALHLAVERAEAASNAKSQFLANMSHEIRTPLNGVLGIAQLLALTKLDDRQADYVQTIQSSGRALLAIIEDILDLSKVEAGAVTLNPRLSNPAHVVRETVEGLRAMAGRKSLALNMNVAAALDLDVMIDADRFRQVLTNLLGNAIKFTDSGSVTVSARRVDRGRMMRLEVTDTGPGLSQAVQDQIFDRFVQADMSHSRPHEGAGLGLAIARELVELAGGAIGVISKPGEGATFWFEQPLTLPEPLSETDALAAPAAIAATRSHSLKVLVVDDQKVNRDVTGEMVRKSGYTPELADSGLKALEMLARKDFHAVLMDLHMPAMGGEEAIRRIRNGEAGRQDIPIFVVTADATVETRDRVSRLNVNGFFSKPLDMEALSDALNGLGPQPVMGVA